MWGVWGAHTSPHPTQSGGPRSPFAEKQTNRAVDPQATTTTTAHLTSLALCLAVVSVVAVRGAAPNCTALSTCKDCVKDFGCAWCRASSNCVPGSAFGVKSPASCPTFRWAQCSADGRVALAVLGCVLGAVVLLIVGVVVVCCCCCVCRRGRKSGGYGELDDDVLDARHKRRRVGAERRSSSPSARASSSAMMRINEGPDDSRLLDSPSKTPLTDKRREEMKAKWGAF